METQIKVVGKMDLSKFNKPIIKAPIFPTEVIHFFMGKGKRIVGRSKSGKIAIISFYYKGQWVKEGDDWLCNIIKEEEHKIIISPVKLEKSGVDNFNESLKKLDVLKDKGFKKPFLHPENTRVYAVSH